jgi:hypothetical protein
VLKNAKLYRLFFEYPEYRQTSKWYIFVARRRIKPKFNFPQILHSTCFAADNQSGCKWQLAG